MPDTFIGGHAQYLKTWEHLFFYETYNILVNSKRSLDEKSQYDAPSKRQKELSFVGYLIKSTEDNYFLNARLYDKLP